MTISQKLTQQINIYHKLTLQDKLLQIQVFMFQTVCSYPLLHQVMAVRCIALHLHICLLNRPPSSHAKQAVLLEPFTSLIAVVSVFYMRYVVMIVAQEMVIITSLLVYK